MALIEIDDIADLLGVTFTVNEETVVEYYLDFAKGELEAYLGRPLEPEAFTEIVVPDADGNIYLSNTPVQTIASVSVGSTLTDSDYYTVMPWGLRMDFVSNQYNSIGTDSGDLVYLYDFEEVEYTVDYTGGLDTPAAVNSVLAAVVMRAWRDRVQDIQQTNASVVGVKEIRVEDYSIEYDTTSQNSAYYRAGANPITMFRSEADFLPVKRFKRRSVS